jgi:hypothetical protein
MKPAVFWATGEGDPTILGRQLGAQFTAGFKTCVYLHAIPTPRQVKKILAARAFRFGGASSIVFA